MVKEFGYRIMEPFNITITVANQPITLTVLPTANYYKIIYYAGVLGAISYSKSSKKWELVPEEEVSIADLPPYVNHLEEERVEIALTPEIITQIGIEINQVDNLIK